MSKVSIWLAPPFIHSRMQRLPRLAASAAMVCEWNSPPQLATAMPPAVTSAPLRKPAAADDVRVSLVRRGSCASVPVPRGAGALPAGDVSPSASKRERGMHDSMIEPKLRRIQTAPRSPPRPAPAGSSRRGLEVLHEPLLAPRAVAAGSAPTGTADPPAPPTAPSTLTSASARFPLRGWISTRTRRCCSGTGARSGSPWKSPWPLVGSPK